MVKISKNSYIENKSVNSASKNGAETNVSIMPKAAQAPDTNAQDVTLGETKNVMRTKEELKSAILVVCKKYGVDTQALKKEMGPFFRAMKQGCSAKHINSEEISQEAFTKIVNYVESLIKECGNDVTFDKLMKLHDSKILENVSKLFSSDKTDYTFAELEKMGLIADLARVSGKNIKELSNYKPEQLKPIIEQWKAAYLELKDKKGVTADEISDTANRYIILEKHGISKEKYKEMVANGEAKGLRELLGLKDNERINSAKVIEMFEKQIEDYKKQAAGLSSDEKKEIIAKQRKEMAIILASTDRKDRMALIHVIEHLFADNRHGFLKDLLSSLDPEDREAIANGISNEKLKQMILNPDAFGQTAEAYATDAVATVKRCQSAAMITKSHEELMNDSEFQAIMKKVEAGDELTEEEQKLYNYYNKFQAGEMAGSANHSFLESDVVENILTQMNDDAYSLPNYREVLEEVNKYIENTEDLVISKEEFTALMDKATRDNYSTVVSDIQNGTETELNPPLSKKADAASSTGVGYSNKKSADDVETAIEKLNVSKNQIAPKEEKATFVVEKQVSSKNASLDTLIKESGSKKGIEQFFSNNTLADAVDEAFSSTSTIAQLYAKRMFVTYKAYQDKVLNQVGHNSFSELWNIAAKSVKLSFNASDRSNSADKELVRKSQEEIKDKENVQA